MRHTRIHNYKRNFFPVTDKVKFAKTFNDVFILASIWNLESVVGSSALRKLLHNNYRNLGVFVDTRCDVYNYTVLYSEVKVLLSKRTFSLLRRLYINY